MAGHQEPHQHGPTPTGSVLLDIGASTGALVVHAARARAGAEIEIRRQGAPWNGRHSEVRERRLSTEVFFAALFPALEEGMHEIRWRDDGRGPRRTVRIEAASVSETALR